jgi:hypothetical protein
VTVASLRGRATALYFWSPQGAADKDRIRLLDSIWQELSPSGVSVLSVLPAAGDTAEMLRMFRAAGGVTRALLAGRSTMAAYGAETSRVLVVLDGNGLVDTTARGGVPAWLYARLQQRARQHAGRVLNAARTDNATRDTARWRQSLSRLRGFITCMPGEPRLPVAMYLQVSPLLGLRDTMRAKAIADTLKARFPNSPYADSAALLIAAAPKASAIAPAPTGPAPAKPPLSPWAAALVNAPVPGLGTAVCGGFSVGSRARNYAVFSTTAAYLALATVVADHTLTRNDRYFSVEERETRGWILRVEVATLAVCWMLNVIAGPVASSDWQRRHAPPAPTRWRQ